MHRESDRDRQSDQWSTQAVDQIDFSAICFEGKLDELRSVDSVLQEEHARGSLREFLKTHDPSFKGEKGNADPEHYLGEKY